MAQFNFVAVCLVSVSALVACAEPESDGVGNAPSNGGQSGDGGSNDGGIQNQGAGPSDGGAPGTQTVTTNNTVTNNTVTNGTVTNAGNTTTSGGGCDPTACTAQCFANFQLGMCQGGTCVCEDLFPSGSSGSGFGGGFGFGGAFP